MFVRTLSWAIASIFLLMTPALWGATVVVEYTGVSDPTSEGWVPNNGSNHIGVFKVPMNDGGTSVWRFDDDSTLGGTYAWFRQDISGAAVAEGQAAGWIAETTLRVIDGGVVGGSPFFAYRDGSTSWQLEFGTDGDGDAIVVARDNSVDASYTLEGLGSGYFTYSMVFDPLTGTADIFVDGNEVISDYAGFALTSTATLNWGAGSSADTGEGRFAAASLSIVPIPAAAWLFGSALAGLGWLRRKG